MKFPELEAKLYTLDVKPHDIVVLHLEYEMEEATSVACTKAFGEMLRSRGLDNIVVLLQPGQMLSLVPDGRGVE